MDNNDSQQKNAEIKIRVSRNEKDDFFKVCKLQCINPSEWIRQKMAAFVKQQEIKEDIPLEPKVSSRMPSTIWRDK